MPTKSITVPAELYLEHNGVKVFCTYGEFGDIDTDPVSDHYFVLQPFDGQEESFDVRDLRAWEQYHREKGRENHIKRILVKAIDSGEIVAPEEMKDWKEEFTASDFTIKHSGIANEFVIIVKKEKVNNLKDMERAFKAILERLKQY